MTERQLLNDQLQAAVSDLSIRCHHLVARAKELTRSFAPDKPHLTEVKDEFLRLHKLFIDLTKDVADSHVRSSALMREIPSSKTSWQFITNRLTPTKALQHEQRCINAVRYEFEHGVKERAELVDQMEDVVDSMESLVDSEAAS
jgi:hypothetical protein